MTIESAIAFTIALLILAATKGIFWPSAAFSRL
jgi:hypothetical protein